MSEHVPAALRRHTRARAAGKCEYCLLHEDDAIMPHEPDHVYATRHHGPTKEWNLAWTCYFCNRAKGCDLASWDVETGRIFRLFHPLRDRWKMHFDWEDGRILPKTAIGRVTEFLLQLNRPELVEWRRELSQAGRYPG